MAAGSWKAYGAGLEAVIKGDLDLDIAARMILVTAAYTPNQSLHALYSDVSANEVAAGGGYATSGKLASPIVSRTGLVVKYDVADQTWAASTITAKYAIIVQDANADGTLAAGDRLIAYVDLETTGGSLSSTNADFTVGIDATNGAVSYTAS